MKQHLATLLLAAAFACGGQSARDRHGAVAPKTPLEVPTRADRVEPTDLVALATPPAGAERTPSGLASQVLFAGSGDERPTRYSAVRVHYTGWTADGTVFDSSRQRGKPAEFSLEQVIPGWTEGLQLMTVGEERRFWIPARLAYGTEAHGGRPAGDLTFDVELLSILRTPPIPPVPADVAAVPADATKTRSGLAYKILTPGDGKHPKASDSVRIEFTGWSTDGTMFDSTLSRDDGQVVFPLENGLKGWVEGIQLMQVGGTARFWIPPSLALGDAPPPPTPKGMLVFDIRLVGIGDR